MSLALWIKSFFILTTAIRQSQNSSLRFLSIPFLFQVPSGRLSGPILKPLRCFLGFDDGVSFSSGLLGAMTRRNRGQKWWRSVSLSMFSSPRNFRYRVLFARWARPVVAGIPAPWCDSGDSDFPELVTTSHDSRRRAINKLVFAKSILTPP